MDRYVSVLGGMTRNRPLNSREMPEPVQTNHQKALIPSSYHNSIFNPLLPNTLRFGFGSNTQVNPPIPLLNSSGNENSNLGSSQWSNDLSRITDGGTEIRQPVYQRMRWSDDMVKILITAISYIEEDALFYYLTTENGNLLVPPIKGKWRAISYTMIEKGHLVSPQQCEDKFNDLNKRYKRLNEILGKGTACEIVKNPSLVDVLSINDEAKEEVTKLLSSKQLFFREMCSFHNKNRKYLPHDEGLKKIVQSALKGKVKYMSQDVGVPLKIHKQGEGIGVSGNFTVSNGGGELTNFTHEAVEGVRNLDQRMKSRSVQLEGVKYMSRDVGVPLKRQKQGEGTGVSGIFTLANGVGELTNFTHGAVEGVRNLDQRMKSRSVQLDGVKYMSQDVGVPLKRQKQGGGTGVPGNFTHAIGVGELTNFTHGAVEGVRNLDQRMKSRSVQLEGVKYMSQDVGVPLKSQKHGEGTGVSGNFTIANGVGVLTNFTHGAVEGVRNLDQRMKSRSVQLYGVKYMSQDVGVPLKRHKQGEGIGVSGNFTLAKGVGELTNFTHEAVEGVRNLDHRMKSRSVQLEGKVNYMSQDVGVPSKRQKQGEGTRVSGNFTPANGVGELTNFAHEAVGGVRNLDQRMKSRSVQLEGKVNYMSQDVGVPSKRQKQGGGTGVSGNFTPANGVGELTNFTHEAVEGVRNLDQWMKSRLVQLEEKALLIKKQMLELEKSKIEWMKLCEKEDRELNKMKRDNEKMMLENKRLWYEIECQKKRLC